MGILNPEKKILLIFLFIIIPLLSLFSHPHMLVLTRIELEFEEKNLKGFWVELEFDKFFSGEIIWAYDEDDDGNFNKQETENLYKGAFSSLEDYYYFTFIRIGEDRFSPSRVSSFSARADGPERLFYKYYVPLERTDLCDLHIALYDYSFFCAVRYQDDYLSFRGGIPENIIFELEENENFPVYYNPAGKADDMTLYDKWAPGLKTFIPKEIHVQF